ncbi:oligosaccharide flippase family protein [Paraburkholderia ferrariae]|uniref:oligosaccharide flippase family protein n=1 Tax=Paraburkholderia ferrariae TaxID=386056 RepID=UPI000485680A|nr:oligosaccharide flippase family protein [Paraburkholderia ferrariae]
MTRSMPLARFGRVAGWSVAGALAGRAAALVSAVLLARVLGPARYGEYVLVLATVTSIASLSTSGLGVAASKYLGDFYGTRAPRRDCGVLIVMLAALLYAVLAGGLFAIAAPSFAREHFRDENETLVGALELGALAILPAVVQGVVQGTLYGLERFRTNAWISSAGAISLACTVPLSAWLGGVTGALEALLAVTGAWACYGAWVACAGIGWRDAWHATWRGPEARRFLAVSTPIVLSALTMAPVNWLALSLLARTPAGFAQIGQYNAAYQWYVGLTFIPTVIAGTVLPALSRLRASGDGRGFAMLTRHSILANALIACASSLAVWLMAGWMMWLYGPAYHGAAPLLRWLAFAAAANGLNAAIGQIMTATNRLWFGLLVNVLWGGIYLSFAWYQVPRTGALGLAQGLVLAYVVHTLIHLAFLRLHLRETASAQHEERPS